MRHFHHHDLHRTFVVVHILQRSASHCLTLRLLYPVRESRPSCQSPMSPLHLVILRHRLPCHACLVVKCDDCNQPDQTWRAISPLEAFLNDPACEPAVSCSLPSWPAPRARGKDLPSSTREADRVWFEANLADRLAQSPQTICRHGVGRRLNRLGKGE